MIITNAKEDNNGVIQVNKEIIENSISKKPLLYDKNGAEQQHHLCFAQIHF